MNAYIFNRKDGSRTLFIILDKEKFTFSDGDTADFYTGVEFKDGKVDETFTMHTNRFDRGVKNGEIKLIAQIS